MALHLGRLRPPGPAGVWNRVHLPLIDGTPLTGLQRLLILADAANGISGDLPWGEWMFIPPGITVTLLREPVGEWVHMAARTTLGADGIGLCHAVLADTDGPVALASQPLLVSPRLSAQNRKAPTRRETYDAAAVKRVLRPSRRRRG